MKRIFCKEVTQYVWTEVVVVWSIKSSNFVATTDIFGCCVQKVGFLTYFTKTLETNPNTFMLSELILFSTKYYFWLKMTFWYSNICLSQKIQDSIENFIFEMAQVKIRDHGYSLVLIAQGSYFSLKNANVKLTLGWRTMKCCFGNKSKKSYYVIIPCCAFPFMIRILELWTWYSIPSNDWIFLQGRIISL